MNDPKQLSASKQALLKIRTLKQQIVELQSQQSAVSEPIAIVSMACRFPRRSNTPEAFWQSLIDQSDEVSEIPDDRWDLDAFHDDDPDVPGKMYARKGVFLDNLDLMDPEFFGISPREATWVDPQQRLLMEVGWEALERAGWVPERIGEHTGIFVGWMHNDYQNEASDSFLNLNPYIATGAAGSFLCGRLAYHLGLQGPSIAVDTACSSSLVALHLACQSLQQRDCDRALVGGVNAICSPTTNILTCKLKALSPHGHSRAFDAAADGYLRGEGCGVVTLRRLADAERDGDPIIGIINGSAIGHNGFSSGLTAPNPKAQENVIRQALKRARLSPQDVAYLEAHGTGTELGDPIEMKAAAAALAAQRSQDNPLLVGSVKTNIGHLEAAAGMAGLIKVLLSLENGCIPGQLNFETPNPHIPWDTTAVRVLTEPTAWPGKQRVAGVSAFGMSGTNAHVIVTGGKREAAQRESVNQDNAAAAKTEPQLITISGKSEESIAALAQSYLGYLAESESPSLADIAFTSNTCRSHFEHRAAIVVSNQDDAIAALNDLAHGKASDSVFTGNGRRPAKVAWQFTGQGSQYVGMARGLYDSEPAFRQAIDECDAMLQKWRNDSLIDVLFHREADIDHTSWTQPAIFAVQMGLAQLLTARGLSPDVVWGHSVGQYAAACVAGVMSWEDGLKLISERGRLIGQLPAAGRMLAVFAPYPTVESQLQESHVGDAVSIAALNGTHIVLSGQTEAVDVLEERLQSAKIVCKGLTTSHAFHSSLMEPVLQPFADFAGNIAFEAAHIPLICNVSGKVLDASTVLSGDYWAQHIRSAVRFSDCLETAQKLGCELILELGPQEILTRMAAADWKQSQDRLVSCLHRNSDNCESMLRAIAGLYTHGVDPDFAALYEGQVRRQVLLPTYPFQRRRFWGPDKPRAAHAEHHTAHPLLGGRLLTPDNMPKERFECFVDEDSPAWIVDHKVMEQTVMPGAAFLEMALASGRENAIEDVAFEQPLQLNRRTSVQTIVDRSAGAEVRVETHSLAADQKTWIRHFHAKLKQVDDAPASVNLNEIRQQCSSEIDRQQFYAAMADLGLQYGPAFQTIRSLHTSSSSILTKLAVEGDIRGYNIPPPLLDGALHSLAARLLVDEQAELVLPVGLERMVAYAPLTEEIWCHAHWVREVGAMHFADLELFNADGTVLLTIQGLQLRKIDRAAMRRMSGGGAERLIYSVRQQPYAVPADRVNGTNWLVVGESDDTAVASIAASLTQSGQTVRRFTMDIAASEMLEAVGAAPDGIAWLLTDDTQASCTGLLSLVKMLKQNEIAALPCGLALITRAATRVPGGHCDPVQTQYQGLGRVLGAEHPELRCRLIDLCNHSEETLRGVANILMVDTKENELAVDGNSTVVPRLGRVRRKPGRSVFDQWGNRSCLITGGLGSLGRQAAAWLAENDVPHVVLVSRRQPDEDLQAELQHLKESGCSVVVHSADVTSHEQMSELINRFGNEWPELGGVIHAAGVLDDGRFIDQSWERFAPVIRTKVQGAVLLNELTDHMRLNFFVLYSSAASVLGSPGQSNYALANAFLDGLAHQRQMKGKVATSINWGPWASGMADDDLIRKRLLLQGITPLTADEAHAAMEVILEQDLVQATVMDVDWRRMQMGLGADSAPLLEALRPPRQQSQMDDSEFVTRLKQQRGGAQMGLVVETLQDLLQTTLSTPDRPDTDRPLIEMGLDSLMAVEFSTQLQMTLGEQFPVGPTMLFDHPTIDAIATHVLEMVAAEEDSEDSTDDTPAVVDETPQLREREPVAIVGMSCRFPGARDLKEFWENLLDGVDSVCEIPSDRWDIDRFFDADRAPGKMYTKQGGFIGDIADFDAAFFNISDQEACWIDPQHRMLLENSYRALEHAGISPYPLTDANVGVFMGIMGQDYAFLPRLDDEEIIHGFQGAGLSHSAGVGRISYVFGFEGPSVAVDTASSSSLVALYQAVRSLQDGNCNMALAGGVNAILAPVNSLLMSKAGLLSPDGRCKSFSAAADGFGRGEGCGVVVLKRLSDAQRDGDNVLAVVRGGAVVHNGFTSGITSPNGKSQARVIAEALRDAKVAPSQVQYLEAHGTGTELGDPLELGAAASVYGKGRRKDQPLLVGSVKGNITHLEAAGGISGLIKTVLSLHHGIIPPQANFDEPSPHIPWKRIPLRIVAEPTAWPEVEERFAGVTAIGLVGTNAHVVLSGAPCQTTGSDQGHNEDNHITPALANGELPRLVRQDRSWLLVLSARSQAALAGLGTAYRDFLVDNPRVSLADVCHTAATGRRHYEHRTAMVVDSHDAAIQALEKLAANPGTHSNDDSFVQETSSQPKTGWVFTGDGQSSLDAAHELYVTAPAFRDLISELDERLNELQSPKNSANQLSHWLDPSSPSDNGHAVRTSSVHLFAFQAGLVHVWRSWGVEADAVFGRGVGQYTAACVSGGLCFKDAVMLIARRESALAAIAANPENKARVLDEFEEFADTLNYYPPNLQIVCSLDGAMVPVHRSLGGSYWRRHLKDSSITSKSLQSFRDLNCDLILNVGPDSDSVFDESTTTFAKVVSSIDGESTPGGSMLNALGQLYVTGVNPDFTSVGQDGPRRRIALPHYPFQKKRYWITEISHHMEPVSVAE